MPFNPGRMFPYSDQVPAKKPRTRSRLTNAESNKKAKARRKLWAADKRCHYCRREVRLEHATIDHKIPLSKGGPNTYENFLLACETCNKLKGNLDYEAALPIIAAWWRIQNLQVSRERREAGDI